MHANIQLSITGKMSISLYLMMTIGGIAATSDAVPRLCVAILMLSSAT
nr:hypothetical protein [Porphyromonas cangingivalis]